ncbi:protein translocase subunit SecF [Paenibacillus sp. WQ 127069]|uniref:Multifunctional fusion protein n=1 Tax=Paenibacillus baimaensis TaxID=2982185 RepID=A0ABT2UR31_9BACL|nr:protein translocase subunit SecF [Paenibacillus sp. WQ 127069]MCU6797100.1 protein translocase subunit SecF [Paenibacillus sp. WQ 127069]
MKKWARLCGLFLFLVCIGSLVASTTSTVVSNIKLGSDLKGGFEILYQVEPLDSQQTLNADLLIAMEQMIDKRVNISKVSEPEITIEGTDRIRVKIAGAANEEQLRQLIGKPANLTFKSSSGELLLDGRDLAPVGAKLNYDNLNRPVITVTFLDPDKLVRATQAHVGQLLLIALDDEVISFPRILQPISGGTATIEGNFTTESANELKELINAGSLPAKLIEKQVVSVNASLGEMALQQTLFAGFLAFLFICVFMLVVYRLPGFVAILSLVGFIYLCLVVLDFMNAALTLPGIAGFILAVGMAVDANIITSERILEELHDGKSVLSAFRKGQKDSFITILDAHMTTLIAAVVLLNAGSSSVQGFSLILIMTLIASMITNVFGTRCILWIVLSTGWFNHLTWYGIRSNNTGKAAAKISWDIVKVKKWFLYVSLFILLCGTGTTLAKGLTLGVDFKSGTRLDVYVGTPFEVQAVADIIHTNAPESEMKPVTKYGDSNLYATTTFDRPVAADRLKAMETDLKAKYGDQVSKQDVTVDPVIAQEMVKKAGLALLIASGGVVIYMAIRFQLSFGIACVVALLHDVLIPVSLFAFFRIEIDPTFVAAILTIVGYSINDTIVIFDRIRTNLKRTPSWTVTDLDELVNRSLWQTMRRSIYTVLTVFICAMSLQWFAGEGLHSFSLALILGLISGTYSSIFIAAQLWLVIVKRYPRLLDPLRRSSVS